MTEISKDIDSSNLIESNRSSNLECFKMFGLAANESSDFDPYKFDSIPTIKTSKNTWRRLNILMLKGKTLNWNIMNNSQM